MRLRTGADDLMDEELVKATNEARLRALRGENGGAMVANADKGYWDYAGKVGAGGAGQQIATNAEPALAALKNRGAMDLAGLQASTDIATTGMKEAGGTGRAHIAGQYGLQGTAMEQEGAGARSAAQTGSAELIAKMQEDAATGRITQQGKDELQRLLMKGNFEQSIGRDKNKTDLEIAKQPRYFSPGAFGSLMQPGGMGALGDIVNGGGSAQYTPEQEALIAKGVGFGYGRDAVIADLKKRGRL